jgi:hypothetical protein
LQLICSFAAWYCFWQIKSVISTQIDLITRLSYINNCGDAYTKINKDLYVRKLVLSSSSLMGLEIEIIALIVIIVVNSFCHIPLIYG